MFEGVKILLLPGDAACGLCVARKKEKAKLFAEFFAEVFSPNAEEPGDEVNNQLNLSH